MTRPPIDFFGNPIFALQARESLLVARRNFGVIPGTINIHKLPNDISFLQTKTKSVSLHPLWRSHGFHKHSRHYWVRSRGWRLQWTDSGLWSCQMKLFLCVKSRPCRKSRETKSHHPTHLKEWVYTNVLLLVWRTHSDIFRHIQTDFVYKAESQQLYRNNYVVSLNYCI